MADMLVKLYDLPPLSPLVEELRQQKIAVRRAYPFEISAVMGTVEKLFDGSLAHAEEVSVGFANKPISIYVAVDQSVEKPYIVGVAAYECVRRNFFGPLGVTESCQGRGIGKALLVACLHGLAEMGYVYGIISNVVGTERLDFYKKTCDAVVIDGSDTSIYRDMLWLG